jgi:hypothetical protein
MLAGVASPASVATVQRDFGLFWSTYRWNYVGGSGSTIQSAIKTLFQVASEVPAREPNFFELLKASILSGSLGKTAGTSRLTNSTIFDAYTDQQIIQIGANIIDQNDADSYPTRIDVADPTNPALRNTASGVENLPYLNRMFTYYYRLTTDAGNNRGYLLLELFNPHRPKANTTNAPTDFRVLATGRVTMYSGSVEDTNKAPWVYGYTNTNTGQVFMPATELSTNRLTDTNTTPPYTVANGLKSASGPVLTNSPPLQFRIPSGSTNLFTWPTLLTQSWWTARVEAMCSR